MFKIIDMFIATIAIAFIIYSAVVIMQYEKDSKKVSTYKYEIACLNASESLSGSTFLTFGDVKTSPYYYFYKVNKDGSIKLTKVPAENSKIYENENKKPYVVEKSTMFEKKYEIHIPQNSIIKKYNPNLIKEKEKWKKEY